MSIDLNSLDEETRKKVINLQNLSTTMEYLSQQKLQIETSLRDTELAIEELESVFLHFQVELVGPWIVRENQLVLGPGLREYLSEHLLAPSDFRLMEQCIFS